jgi:hypothetical protein
LKAALDNLSQRERMLLKVMVGVFAFLALAVVIGLSQRSIGELRAETATYESALQLLATAGPNYIEAQGGQAEDPRLVKFTDEVLDEARVQLTSFVATQASAAGISVSSYDEDQHTLGSARPEEGMPIIIERQLRIDIREAQMDRLIDMLHRIEESGEPVVIKRIDIRALRDEGSVRVRLFVSTFQRRMPEGS